MDTDIEKSAQLLLYTRTFVARPSPFIIGSEGLAPKG